METLTMYHHSTLQELYKIRLPKHVNIFGISYVTALKNTLDLKQMAKKFKKELEATERRQIL